jgi:hypothetical protein
MRLGLVLRDIFEVDLKRKYRSRFPIVVCQDVPKLRKRFLEYSRRLAVRIIRRRSALNWDSQHKSNLRRQLHQMCEESECQYLESPLPPRQRFHHWPGNLVWRCK